MRLSVENYQTEYFLDILKAAGAVSAIFYQYSIQE